jgi:hypothetical protein
MFNKQLISLLRYGAITGNILFILWITYNGIEAGFRGSVYEKISFIALTLLLVTNNFFLITRTKDVGHES